MSKAFNSLSHISIIESLISTDPPLNPYIINWIGNFLENRQMRTYVNATASTTLCTNQGVPQGSVGGPFLYNSAANDISVLDSHMSTLTAFADDNNPCCAGIDGVDNASSEINNLVDGFARKNLRFNRSKSKELRVRFRKANAVCSPVMDIPLVDEISILGFTFDSNLSFHRHVQKTSKKAYSALYQITRIKHFGYSRDELRLMYNSLVLSRLRYGLGVWGGEYKSTLKLIDDVQRKAMRLGVIAEFTPVSELIAENDQKLLHKVLDNPQHPLSAYMPQRSGYAMQRLRNRLPGTQKTTQESLLRLFPNRVLRTGNM